jgi:GNAT superfamily N-acetyltransferase
MTGRAAPTTWRITRGTIKDYRALACFHYLAGPPALHKRVYVIRPPRNWPPCDRRPACRTAGTAVLRNLCTPRLAAVLVVSPPAAAVAGRNYATGGRYAARPRKDAFALLNREVECISRVVVHPIFRSCGLAVRLVRHALATAQTPMVESLAAMGAIHPLFTRGGLRCFGRYKGGRNYVYYLGRRKRRRREN